MRNKDEIFRTWAPPESLWSPWVKSVLFSLADAHVDTPAERAPSIHSGWLPRPSSTALIIDLPGDEGVLWASKLTEAGYRAVPLYNALPFPPAEKTIAPSLRPPTAVYVESILGSLIRETDSLAKIKLMPHAPPAFLLDADRRMARIDIAPGVFDNRSICFTTDFPSADFLLGHGISEVVVVQETVRFSPDLLELLVNWQKKGIRILRKLYRDQESPIVVQIKNAPFLSRLWFRLMVLLGFHRGELGAFGEIVSTSSG